MKGFIATMFAAHQFNIAFDNTELARKKPDQTSIGRPINRRGGDAQLEAIAVDAGEFVVAGARLNA